MSTQINVAIIGSGPSGYTAALYAARAKLEPVMFAGFRSGGQLMWTSDVENYPGFPDGINGPKLMAQMRLQAEKFGTQIHDVYVTAVDLTQRPFRIWTTLPDDVPHDLFENGSTEDIALAKAKIMQAEADFTAQSVIISTGAASIMLNIPGESQLMGRGVSTCAVCDAAFYEDKVTYVVGGGDSAMEDTMALTKFAKQVTVIHRRDSFKASKIMQERVLSNPKVKVLWNTQVTEVLGPDKVSSIKIKVADGAESTLPADGFFVAIGHRPITGLFADQVQLDSHGYVVTRQSYSKAGAELASTAFNEHDLLQYPSMTSVDGVFAAGDVVDVRYKQAVTAAAQGCAAAIDVERWLEENKK
ncbi:MAG: FAD-dependent oxidoreductase [bacterium]|nr:FAD-dependent oxidoreductase [bacterium]